jgi:transposase
MPRALGSHRALRITSWSPSILLQLLAANDVGCRYTRAAQDREGDARHFIGESDAFLGLTPKQNSSGGKERLGRISKMGNRYLRKLLVVGAHAVLYHRKPHQDALRSFAKKLMQTKPFKLVAAV